MKRGPIYSLHNNRGTVFLESEGWVVPASFSSPERELEVLGTSVGLVDLSGWGVLRLSGDDRLDFVHRLSTNDVSGLGPGQGSATVFTTPIGRIVDLAFVFVREHDLLLLIGRGADEVVAAWLQKHIFFNDNVTVERITSQVALMGCRGPDATAFLNQLADRGVEDLTRFCGCSTTIADAEVTVVSSVPHGNGYLLMVDAKDAPALWSESATAVASISGAPVGDLAIEAARISGGIPRFGRELTDQYIPLETGLRWAISFNKGCYVGQEIIARMETRKRLAKRLVVLSANEPCSEHLGDVSDLGSWLKVGAEVRGDGVPAGRLTSVSPITVGGSIKALAYIKTALAKPGRQVDVSTANGTLTMRVSLVPDGF